MMMNNIIGYQRECRFVFEKYAPISMKTYQNASKDNIKKLSSEDPIINEQLFNPIFFSEDPHRQLSI